MRRLADSDAAELGDRAMLADGQSFRDAFVASRFAAFRDAENVRLLRPRHGQPTPDFAILLNDVEEQWFEITEADRPGRRRQHEYQCGFRDERFRSLTDEEWTDADTYQDVVRSIVTKKAAKSYDQCQGLIVWSNAFGITDDDKIGPLWWLEACGPGLDRFEEVWVHYRDRFHLVTRL